MTFLTAPDPADTEAHAERMKEEMEAKRAAELEAEHENMMEFARRAARKREAVDEQPYIEDKDLAFLKGK